MSEATAVTSPLILALETSTEWCSVALCRGAQHWLRHENTGPKSSQRILPMVAEVLAEAGVQLADCTAIAFGEGPGAFTGLRTACGVVQGLAFGADLPVIAVDTLMSCAEQYRQDAKLGGADLQVFVAVDARMDETYWASYQWQAASQQWQRLGAVQVTAPEAVVIPAETAACVGNAFTEFAERMPQTTAPIFPATMPHGLAVASIAQGKWARGETIPAALAAPVYVRDKVALTTQEREVVAAQKAALNQVSSSVSNAA